MLRHSNETHNRTQFEGNWKNNFNENANDFDEDANKSLNVITKKQKEIGSLVEESPRSGKKGVELNSSSIEITTIESKKSKRRGRNANKKSRVNGSQLDKGKEMNELSRKKVVCCNIF